MAVGLFIDRTPIGEKDSCRYQSPKSGTLNSISMYIQTANAAVRFGIYSDLNGRPNQLLRVGADLVTTTGNSWVNAPISVPVFARPKTTGSQFYLTDGLLEL